MNTRELVKAPISGPAWRRMVWLGFGLVVVVIGCEWLIRSPSVVSSGSAWLQSLRILRGFGVSLVMSLGIGAFYSRRWKGVSAPLGARQREVGSSESSRRREMAQWLVQMRWIAAALALGLITVADKPSQGPLLVWWSGLVLANLAYETAFKRFGHLDRQLVLQLAVDLVFLTGFLNASGGLENPLFTIYLFPVIIARLLLEPRKAMMVTILAAWSFGFLAVGEYLHLLPHYTNFLFPHEAIPDQSPGGVTLQTVHPDGEHASYDLYFVLGRTIPFLIVLLATDYFAAGIIKKLRTSERDLENTARRALLEHQQLESVVDASGIGMMLVGPGIEVQWHSARLDRWFGWEGLENNSECPLFRARGGCAECLVAETLKSGKGREAERTERQHGSGEKFFRHSTAPIRNRQGRVVQVVEVIEETTSRRALEAEAIRAGKLSALGQMAAGIAHEIGNPLSSINTRLSLMERQTGDEYVAESIEVVKSQMERISRIVHGVSNFARSGEMARTRWEVNCLLSELLDVVKLDPRSRGVEFRPIFKQPSPTVDAVRDQIAQIVLNLLLNAVESMSDGGCVTVSSESSSDEVVVVVEDEGTGIEESALEHIFEPFYTSKQDGSGLGLSISYGLAVSHGGKIEVEARRSCGSRFELILPRSQGESPTLIGKDG